MWGKDDIGPINLSASNNIDFSCCNRLLHQMNRINILQRSQSGRTLCISPVQTSSRKWRPVTTLIDNSSNFIGKLRDSLCGEFRDKHLNSSLYRQQMNGVVKAANKRLNRILKEMVTTYDDWHEKLPFAILAYRTTTRTSACNSHTAHKWLFLLQFKFRVSAYS